MTRAWWKWLGLAGVVGVAITGAAVARQERERRDYTPDQVRERLHARHAQARVAAPGAGEAHPSGGLSGWMLRVSERLPRRLTRSER